MIMYKCVFIWYDSCAQRSQYKGFFTITCEMCRGVSVELRELIKWFVQFLLCRRSLLCNRHIHRRRLWKTFHSSPKAVELSESCPSVRIHRGNQAEDVVRHFYEDFPDCIREDEFVWPSLRITDAYGKDNRSQKLFLIISQVEYRHDEHYTVEKTYLMIILILFQWLLIDKTLSVVSISWLPDQTPNERENWRLIHNVNRFDATRKTVLNHGYDVFEIMRCEMGHMHHWESGHVDNNDTA